jgi:hypothetical protein
MFTLALPFANYLSSNQKLIISLKRRASTPSSSRADLPDHHSRSVWGGLH